MATTPPNLLSSAQLRRLIGLQAGRLRRALPAAKASLPPRNEEEDEDQISEEHSELTSIHRSVLEPFSKLQSLHQQWLIIISSDEKEREVYHDFVNRKGDYTKLLEEAVSFLEEVDGRLHGLDQIADELNIMLRTSPDDSIRSDLATQDKDEKEVKSVLIRSPTTTARPPQAQYGFASNLSTTLPQPLLHPTPIQQPPIPTATQHPLQPSLAPIPSFPLTHPSMPPQFSVTPASGYPVPLDASFLEAALLQRLDVPTFTGQIEEFPEFWTRFHSLVHSKMGIDPGSKFSLLKSCLRGPPLDTLAGIPVTSTNYDLAVSLLHATYNDPTTIRHLLYSRLMSLPRCDEKTVSQRFAQMNALVRQFVCLDPTGSQEFGLAACLFEKLPRSIRARILDKTPSGSNLTPNSLMDILGAIVRRDFIIDSMSPKDVPTHNVYYNSGKPGHKQKPAQFVKPNSTSSGDQRQPLSARCCSFCDGGHGSFSCPLCLDDRIQAVKQKHLCFNCLSPDHGSKNCPSNLNCRGCRRRHHTTICKSPNSPLQGHTRGPNIPSRPQPSYPRTQAAYKESPGKPRRSETTTYVAIDQQTAPLPIVSEVTCSASTPESSQDRAPHNSPVALMCLPVTLCNPDKPELSITTTAFFDSGSTRSYVSREMAKALELTILKDEEIVINVFGEQSTTMHSQLHQLHLQLPDGHNYPIDVRSLPALAHDVPCALLPNNLTLETPTATLERKTPGILVGADHFWQLILWEGFSAKTMKDGLRLLHTRIGPILAGPTLTLESVYYAANEDISSPLNKDRLDQLVERFWEFETVGLTEPSPTDADSQCLELFQKTIRFDAFEKRFYCKWPFRMPTEELPTNQKLAYSRLWNTWKVLSKNQENMQKYSDIIDDQLKRNIIEIAPSTPDAQGHTHYLAHHAVVTENKKTTKVRMVFDASAKEKGKLSLNDTLFRGPVLLPDICGILLRARFTKILISADIEKAFLMVGLEEPDRDFTRFLWLKDITRPPSDSNVVTLRFRRVPFGVISSPFMLAGTIHHLLSNCEDHHISAQILENLYVDNMFVTTNSDKEGQKIYATSKDLFNSAGMNLREWTSNDKNLNTFLEEREGVPPDTDAKILGLRWNTKSDTLQVQLQQPPDDQKTWTKRSILQYTAATFDPLGLLSPVILRYKLFIQRLWKEDNQWDEQMTPEQRSSWISLLNDDRHSSPFVEQPRQLCSIGSGCDVTLHVFSDASKDGMGACAYIRVQEQDKVTVSLLMAKTRICPAKREITIPRLELSALATGSSLANYLKKELKIDFNGVYLWTDSTAAIGWCHSSKDHLPIFVSNRVRLVRSNVPDAVIQHVDGTANPADLASRGVNFTALLTSSLWWNGPQFLQEPKENWIQMPPPTIPTLYTDEPHRIDVPPSAIVCSASEQLPTLIDSSRFSTWTKMLNTLMLVLLFIKMKTGAKFSKMLLGPWYGRTEGILRLFRMAQQERPPTDHIVTQLNLHKDRKSGLWQMKTRVEQLENLPYLPSDSRITELYILHTHHELLHAGVSTTLNQLRRRVWIPKGRNTVKKAIRSHCFECRRKLAKPFALPPFPALPDSRTNRPPYPFFNSGMDYLGPFNTSENKKIHICLFTCLSTRLIYAEVAVDLRANTFTNILRRFIATNGSPRNLISDNALHFTTSASVYLQLLLKDSSSFPEFDTLCLHHQINFKFIPAFAPWAGGTYERMVGLLKNALGHCLSRTPPSIDELRTFLAEAVAVVNSRPLTYVSSEPSDQGVACIRPIDFIRPSVNICAPSFEIERDLEWTPQESTRKELLETWHQTTARLDQFWQRWSSEYLQELKERYQRKHDQGHYLTRRTPFEGEIVLIHQDFIPRGLWKMGRILKVSSDVVRSAELRVASGKTITRPISLLYPLEVLPPLPPTENRPDLEKAKEPKKLSKASTTIQKNNHAMVTRNKARLHLLFATILLALFAPNTSAARCPKNDVNLRILFAESCHTSSIAIASFGTTGNDLCWTTVDCPLGHVRFQPTAARSPNTKLCGDRCSCPATVTCTHYSGPRANESQAQLMPDIFSTYTPPYVCSFSTSSLCSNNTEMTTVPFITLHDGTTYVVETLQIHQPEYDEKDSPVCFFSNGSLATFSRTIRMDGTPGFCSAFNCVPNYEIFCALRTPTAIFSTTNFTVPVSNWGHILRSYHPFPAVSKMSTDETYPIVLCTKGGVQLFNTDHHFVEICINPLCIRHSDYKDGTPLLFPTTLVIFDYSINIKMWKEGSLTYSSSKKCAGHPICETIYAHFVMNTSGTTNVGHFAMAY